MEQMGESLDPHAIVVIKPGMLRKAKFIKREIEKHGFKVIKEEKMKLSVSQVNSFYQNDAVSLITLGKKISSSCADAGIDTIGKFGIKSDNHFKLGILGGAWNRAYISSGPVRVMLVGPNGDNPKEFFTKLGEIVDFLRNVIRWDTIFEANNDGRAHENGIHLSRNIEEFIYQVKVVWPLWE